MIKVLALSILIFNMHSANAEEVGHGDECFVMDQITDVSSSVTAVVKQNICENTPKIKSQAELDATIKSLFNNQTLELAKTPKDRHKIAAKLNDCSPEKDSEALVINFAGTGSFNPKSFDVMKDMMACFAESKLDPTLNNNVFQSVAKYMKAHHASEYEWDGIEAGVMDQFFQDPYLQKKAKVLDFATFASEESEMIANPEKIGWNSFQKLPAEILSSTFGVPKGIVMAQQCVNTYLEKAKALKIKPKIIVVSHSSGGRSAVKFAENLKHTEKDLKLDLVFSMDPVKEAHEAMKDVVSQYAGRAMDEVVESTIPYIEIESKPVHVWSVKQPKVLYKPSNASRWVNVYQNKDTEGLKGPVKFGIKGSPVHNADVNIYVKKNMGSGAHGTITYAPETTSLFIKEMKSLLGD